MEPALKISEEQDADLLSDLMRELYEHVRMPFDINVARAASGEMISGDSRGRVWMIRLGGEIINDEMISQETISDQMISDEIIKDEIIGRAALTFRYSLEFHARDAILDELFISEQHRGRGAGKRALRFVD
jgi:acetyltransferase (GNAT) family protein